MQSARSAIWLIGNVVLLSCNIKLTNSDDTGSPSSADAAANTASATSPQTGSFPTGSFPTGSSPTGRPSASGMPAASSALASTAAAPSTTASATASGVNSTVQGQGGQAGAGGQGQGGAGPDDNAGTSDDARDDDTRDDDTGTSSSLSDAATAVPPLEGCAAGPLELPLPGCEPEPPPSTGDFYADCVTRINQLRWECQCLPPLERWTEGESCADEHSQYDYEQDEAHAGFNAGICDEGGWGQNECPGYSPNFGIIDFCLQQMWDEGPGEDFQAHGHYLNMTNERFTRVACGQYTTPEGEIWSVQNFSE